jgi:uncharacterized protein YukE
VSSITLPEIPGDPAGMRALAATLRGIASDISNLESDLTGQARGMVFEGPAGDAFRDRMSGVGERARSAAEELQSLSDLLERSATEVEAAQRAREQRLEQMREDAAREAALAN